MYTHVVIIQTYYHISNSEYVISAERSVWLAWPIAAYVRCSSLSKQE